MLKIKDMQKQAERLLVSRHLELGKKGDPSRRGDDKIHSLSTFQRYKQALGQAGKWACSNHGIRRLDQLTPEIAKAYLQKRIEDGISQKQLDNDRRSMEFVVGKLERIKTVQSKPATSRAYTPEQAERIAARQKVHNALATKIAFNAGLRAHELITLRRADEGSPTPSRQWRDDLFHGREGERYLVTGKGGLVRQVMINPVLAQELEASRRPQLAGVKDRKIDYQCRYDIGGGNSWSGSVSQMSKKELGWSTGAHGMRHGHIQARLEHLLRLGCRRKDAEKLLTQEVGHFRPSIIQIYLR